MQRNDNQSTTGRLLGRRQFLGVAGAGAAAAIAGHLIVPAHAADAPAAPGKADATKAVLKLCSQEGRISGKSLKEKVDKLQSWGAVGIEFNGNPSGRIKEIQDALKGTQVKISALCWGAAKGDLVSMDLEKRKKGIESLKSALNTAGELGSTGVIFVPCFNKESTLSPDELHKILLEILPSIGDHAKKCGTRVLLEPLNKGETFYIKTLKHAASICDEIKNPGIAMMGDFYHMCKEETSDREAFVAAGSHLHHVHLACKARWLPGQDERSFVEGFKGLKQIGYTDFCSLECGVKKGTDAEVEIPKAFRFLEEQWKQAVI